MCRSIVTPLPTNFTCTNCWVFQVSKDQQFINQTILQGSQVTLYFDAFQIINLRNSWGSFMDLQWEREYTTKSKYLCRKDLQWGSNSDCASGEPPHYFCPTGAIPWHIQDTWASPWPISDQNPIVSPTKVIGYTIKDPHHTCWLSGTQASIHIYGRGQDLEKNLSLKRPSSLSLPPEDPGLQYNPGPSCP